MEVFDSKDQQLVQAGKEAAHYLQQAVTETTQPVEQLTEQDKYRPDRLVYPEIPIYDVNLASQHYHLLCGNRNAKKDFGMGLQDDH